MFEFALTSPGDWIADLRDQWPARLHKVSAGALMRLLGDFGEPEERLGRDLGLDRERLAAEMVVLWLRSYQQGVTGARVSSTVLSSAFSLRATRPFFCAFASMATIKRYPTAAGERWEVRYRQPNGATSRKRGFTTKRDASAWASKVETTKAEGAFVSPARGRVTVGDLSVGWLARQEQTLSPSYYRTIAYAYGKHVGPSGPRSRSARWTVST